MVKSKKLMSIVLALTMLCTIFGNFTAFADEDNTETVAHTHAICGETTCTTDHNKDGEADSCESVTYQPLSEALKDYYDSASDTYQGSTPSYVNEKHVSYDEILTQDSYYLDKDITLSSPLYLNVDTLNLCLNGHKLEMAENASGGAVIIMRKSGSTLNLADCNGAGGEYHFKANDDGRWEIDSTGQYTVTGGVITGSIGTLEDSSLAWKYPGGICNFNGTINMYGGNIVGNKEHGIYGGVNLYSGTIQGNCGGEGAGINSPVQDTQVLKMYDGLIANNCDDYSDTDSASAVYCAGGSVMLGGEIKDNSGTGILVAPNGTFTMLNGTVTGNKIGVQGYRFDTYLSTVALGASNNTGTILIQNNKEANLKTVNGQYVTVSDMNADSKIGISVNDIYRYGTAPVQFATGGVAQIKNFSSDNNQYDLAATDANDGLVLQKIKTTTVYFAVAYEGKDSIPYVYTDADNTGYCQKWLTPAVTFTLKDQATADTTSVTSGSGITLPCGHSYKIIPTSSDSVYNLNKENMVLTIADDETLSLDDTEGGQISGNVVTLNVDTADGAYEAHTYTLTTDAENAYVAYAAFNVKCGDDIAGENYHFEAGATPKTLTLYRLKQDASGTPLTYTTEESEASKSSHSTLYENAVFTETATETTMKLTRKTYSVALETANDIDCIVKDEDGSVLWESTDPNKAETISMCVSAFYTVYFKDASGSYTANPQQLYIDVNNGLHYTCDVNEDNDTVIEDVTAADSLRVTLKDTRTYAVQIPTTFVGGTVTADKETAKPGETVTLTVTPDKNYKLATLTATDQNGNDLLHPETDIALLADNASQTYTFQMPAGEVTISATFEINSVYTVKAVVNGATADKNDVQAGTQVNAGDTVKIDVVVAGGDYTNAGWSMLYDPTKFEYVTAVTNSDYNAIGVINLDESRENVLAGTIEGSGAQTDEFTDGVAIVTYEFKAKAPVQNKDVTGTFRVTSAYADNYEMAKTDDKTPAKTENVSVDIVLVQSSTDEDGEVVTPAGTFEDATKVYNAEQQSGNTFALDEKFANATVTYAAAEDGAEVEDMSTLTFKKSLPSWQKVGTYTYYAKVSGAGLATLYDSATLTITPQKLTPNANFAVDPTTRKVVFVPTLEGALDDTHSGTVTVTWSDKTGVHTEELQASDFEHDGETTSKYTGSVQFEVTAATSGEFAVTLTYNANEAADNYTGETNTATVIVDKTTAGADIVATVKAAITNEYLYDSKEHKLTIADLSDITDGNWTVASKTDAYDDTEDPSVTNVGDDRLVKVVFEDENAFYNDIVVYVTLKVNPRNITITIDDNEKVMGEDDPTPLTIATITVYDEENEAVTEDLNDNRLFGTDDLAIEYEREIGEAVGTYEITANFAPNDNYNVTVVNAEFEITAPEINPEDPTAKVKIEVVDLSNEADGTPDYVAGLRMILIYTDLNRVFYGYSETQDTATAEKFYDVTAAGYQYVSHDAFDENGQLTAVTTDDHAYKHVYGLVVDKLAASETGANLEALYRANVVFLSSDLTDAPIDIEYDANINLSPSLDVNDYSMTNGIYHRNESYGRKETIVSMLKADYNHDKVVDTKDAAAVKAAVDERQ